jgi:hypothetical protein
MEFEMNSERIEVLHAWLFIYGTESEVLKTEHERYKLIVEESLVKKHDLIEHISCYINKYGNPYLSNVSTELDCGTEKTIYEIKDGKIAFRNYIYVKNNVAEITIKEMAAKIETTERVNNSNSNGVNRDLVDELYLQEFDEMSAEEILLKIEVQVNENQFGFFELYLNEGKVLLTKGKREFYDWIPNPISKEVSSDDIRLYIDEISIMDFSFDPEEKRMIEIGGHKVPLHEELMNRFHYHNFDSLRNVIVPNGEVLSPCEVCVNKIRKLMGGCRVCKPKKIISDYNNSSSKKIRKIGRQ